MIQLEVNIEAEAVHRGIADLLVCLKDRTELHEQMGFAVKDTVIAHLQELNSRSPKSNFYGKAADSTSLLAADQNGALVSVTHRGMTLRYCFALIQKPGGASLSIVLSVVPESFALIQKPGGASCSNQLRPPCFRFALIQKPGGASCSPPTCYAS